jgi:hypothetical protein
VTEPTPAIEHERVAYAARYVKVKKYRGGWDIEVRIGPRGQRAWVLSRASSPTSTTCWRARTESKDDVPTLIGDPKGSARRFGQIRIRGWE